MASTTGLHKKRVLQEHMQEEVLQKEEQQAVDQQTQKKVFSARLPHNKPGALSQDVREAAKAIILEVLGKTDNKTLAADTAGVQYLTLARWIKEGFITAPELETAYKQWQDTLRADIYKAGIIGDEIVVRDTHGRIVYNPDGTKQTTRKRSHYVLMQMAQHHLPEYQTPTKLDITTHQADGFILDDDGQTIPRQMALIIDMRKLTEGQKDALVAIAQAIQSNPIENTIGYQSLLQEQERARIIESDGYAMSNKVARVMSTSSDNIVYKMPI